MSDGVRCQYCAGTGRFRRWLDALDPDAPMVRCPVCLGTGIVTEVEIRRHEARKTNRDATEGQAPEATLSNLERWLNTKPEAKPETKAKPEAKPEAKAAPPPKPTAPRSNYHPRSCGCNACKAKRRAGNAPAAPSHPSGCPCDTCIHELRARYLDAFEERPATGTITVSGVPLRAAPASPKPVVRHADLRQPRRRRSIRQRLRYALAVTVIVVGFIGATVVIAGIALTDVEDEAVSKASTWFDDNKDRPLIPGLPSVTSGGKDGELPRVRTRRRGWLRNLFD